MARVLSGAILAAAFFAIVWFSSATVLLVVALALGAVTFHEYTELVRKLGAAVPRLPALAATLAAIWIVPFPYVAGEAVVGIGIVVVATWAMVNAGTRKAAALPEGQAFKAAAPSGVTPAARSGPPTTVNPASVYGAIAGGFAIVYIGLPLGALVGVHVFGGRGAVVLLVATVAISDTAQYYSGRLLGKHALAPVISPKKTIEGAVGGFVIAPIFLYFVGPYLVPVAAPLTIAPVGVALVACGIAGDLFESMIKRAADMKDSSALIPGHGGVLDRIDALLFATPPFYMFLRWIYTV